MRRSTTRPRLALLTALFVLLWSAVATAFHPPALSGHVVDSAGALTPDERARLDQKLDTARKEHGFAVVVFIAASLEGESIEDVSYATAKTWGVGSREADDGVVLVMAPKERKIRIETGKGVGGALTDVECSHIIRDVIGPKMKAGRTYEAVDAGTDRILETLVRGTPGGSSAPADGDRVGMIIFLVIVGTIVGVAGVLGILVLVAMRRSSKGGASSTSSSDRTSWPTSSSSSSDSSWSSGSSDSGYSGGGGDFGGGGASGDY